MGSFIRNVLAYPGALIYVFRNGLGSYFLLSGLISVAVGFLAFSGIYFFSDDIGAWIMNFYPWEVGRELLTKYSWIATGSMLTLFSLIIYKYLLLIFIGPFMSPLSEKIEYIETGIQPSGQGIGQIGYAMFRGLRIAIRNIWKELIYTVIVLLLGLIPIFSPFAAVLIFLIQAYYIGFANTDYHLEKTLTVKESIRYCKNNQWALMGNGTGFLLLLFIPVIGLLIAPVLGTVVATREALNTN